MQKWINNLYKMTDEELTKQLYSTVQKDPESEEGLKIWNAYMKSEQVQLPIPQCEVVEDEDCCRANVRPGIQWTQLYHSYGE
jgi:hypothetical protein